MTTAKKPVAKKPVTKKTVSSAPQKAIQTINTDGAQNIFVDGMAALMAGPAISKILFHTIEHSSETEEIRRVTLRLVMSTEVMIDMVAKLQSSIMKNEKMLGSGLDSHKRKTLEFIDNLRK